MRRKVYELLFSFWRKGDGSGEFYFDDLEEKLIINEMLKL